MFNLKKHIAIILDLNINKNLSEFKVFTKLYIYINNFKSKIYLYKFLMLFL